MTEYKSLPELEIYYESADSGMTFKDFCLKHFPEDYKHHLDMEAAYEKHLEAQEAMLNDPNYDRFANLDERGSCAYYMQPN